MNLDYIERSARAEYVDLVLKGPHHAISHSSIWNVTEEELHKLEEGSDYHRVGDCEIYFYNAGDSFEVPGSGFQPTHSFNAWNGEKATATPRPVLRQPLPFPLDRSTP